FDGRPTASGAIFDQQGWTVAHRTLPLGTILLVTRGEASVLVLVNDRGPFVGGRVLDLSKGGAEALGTIRAGVAHVTARVLVEAGGWPGAQRPPGAGRRSTGSPSAQRASAMRARAPSWWRSRARSGRPRRPTTRPSPATGSRAQATSSGP